MSQQVPQVQGRCDERFTAVREAFEGNFRERGELGAAVAVTLGGETVVDLWGGWADAARTRPWERETLVNVWSTSKGPTSLCAHILADRGLLDFDAPVAAYWPEFAAAGKESVLVRHLLSHRAGLAGLREPHSVEQLYDWELTAQRLAAQEPWWEPGTRSGYHAMTFGFLVGEVVRRVSGLLPGAFLEREVTGPLAIDFTIGLPEKEADRAAELVHPRAAATSEQAAIFSQLAPVALAALLNPVVGATEGNTEQWRAAEIPAANGHGTARAVAALYGIFAGRGSWDGRPILSPRPPSGCARARAAAVTWCWVPGSRVRRRSASASGSAGPTDRTVPTRRLSVTTASAAPAVSPTRRRVSRWGT
ncbi:serine hydrolase [Streptomyces avermitilis]|uniref:Serine hydrolase n=1 Tax=Streptomyces avermitilis TaxID=33903 RepID=A0A4D4LRD0_STRAX|nr:serine hydrolase [Streptomyces avermitilis]